MTPDEKYRLELEFVVEYGKWLEEADKFLTLMEESKTDEALALSLKELRVKRALAYSIKERRVKCAEILKKLEEK